MKKTILFVLVLTLGVDGVIHAVEDTWTKKVDMPTATSLHAASVVDGKIYVIGGTDNLFGWSDYWSTVWVYDPTTDTWMKKADMPTGK
ncbi:MAG: kelch repeat-containing protein, partial [Planctomycetota bacterium]